MSTNKGSTSEQIFPWNYPQYYEPPPDFYFKPPPRKDRTAVTVAVVVALVLGATIVPMVLSLAMFNDTRYEDYRNDFRDDDRDVPMAFVSSVDVTGPNDARVMLRDFSRDPAATEFRLILERDGTYRGVYDFPSDTDCALVFASGMDIADLNYVDLNHNLELDPGDEIAISDLTAGSFYEITIIYIPTGYESTYSSFWTPNG